MREGKIYHAFISYSHGDRAYAATIQKSIEKLGLPFYKSWHPNVNIFRDQRKIPLAGSLSAQILDGLKQSEHLIVIASKRSADSDWVKEEILNWHKLNQDEDGYITNFNFILIDDVIVWDYLNKDFDKIKTTALPSFDQRIFKEEPLWANVQQYCVNGKVQTSNSNYEWEIAKIKGLLLGKKPDEIIDEVSKGKRLFRIVSGLIIGILLFLSGFAFYQRQDALFQKETAIRNEKEAQLQKDSALNNLIKFKVEEFGRNLKNGNTYYEAEEYTLAKQYFVQAIETANDTIYNQSIPTAKIQYLDSIYKVCIDKSTGK
ncbi:hypothetical protein D3C71_548480 [compost metagenome]